MRLAILQTAVTAGCLLWAATSHAQFTQGGSGGSQSYGAFGNRTIGGGTRSGTAGFSTGLGSSSQGSNGLSTAGQGNMAGGGQGTSSLSGQPTNTQMRDMSQVRQQAGFVGADRSDAGNVMSMQALQQSQMSSLQNAFSQMSRQNQQRNQQNMNQNRNQQNQKQLRISIRADIPLRSTSATSTRLGQQFETRLKKIPGLTKGHSVEVEMSGRTAVLRGSVPSERDRELAEGLALLEPGISAVQNELVVADAAATGEELPAPRR